MHQCFAVVFCGIYCDCALFQGRVTWRLVSDFLRGSRRASPAGHDIARPGLHLDLPKAHVQYIPFLICTSKYVYVHTSMYVYILYAIIWYHATVQDSGYVDVRCPPSLVPINPPSYRHIQTCLVSSMCIAF